MARKIVVTGSLAYDHIMSMPGRFADHILPDKLHILNVSFIMNTFRQEYGGTGGNIVWNLGLLKTPATLVAAAGEDFGPYKKHLEKANIDLSGLHLYNDTKTARGFVTTDRDDNQIWGFYEGAMKKSSAISLGKYIDSNSLVMIAPNDPVAMTKYVEQSIKLGAGFMFDPAFNIPHFDKKDLKKAIKYSEILIGNDYEIQLIQNNLKLTKKDLLKLAKLVITTLGEKGARIDSGVKSLLIPPANPKNESDPTGAGDAFRGGFLSGYVRGATLDVCGKMGALAAVYTVEKYGTQTHSYTPEDFAKRYKKNFGEELQI